jgi:hypothetical protein
MRFLLFFVSAYLISVLCFGQDSKSFEYYITKYQNVVYIHNDSICKISLFKKPDGRFYFREGHTDTIITSDTILYSIDKKKTVKEYLLKSIKETSEIDTVESFFNQSKIEYKKDSITNYTDYIRYSYILSKIGESVMLQSNDKTIRIVYPEDDLNLCNQYNIIKIKFDNDSVKLNYISIISSNYLNFRIMKNDSISIKNDQFKKFNKLFNKIDFSIEDECRNYGNPWSLEINLNENYKHFFMSYYCPSGKNKKSIMQFFEFIKSINQTYFSD